MSTHNIGFYEDLTKVIFELSANTHLISSAEYNEIYCYFWLKKYQNLFKYRVFVILTCKILKKRQLMMLLISNNRSLYFNTKGIKECKIYWVSPSNCSIIHGI